MSGLLEEGIGLMVLGMGFVFLFLIILIFVTGYMSRLLNHFFPEVQVATPVEPTARSVNQPSIDAQMVAVITAAVHQHRNNNTN
ncbi:oxaloacetate decarboxylase [Marinomonas ushuaiensis DSM 15871]|uniref:Probable oxaloacetate decarboxylase gamma chain n=2 Tax=Marinomonas TaxID=28253 RepID=X7E082_9GAMM|nr:oxaloacetate decarboxylase [Marinomonas ushuaiensis DSM 15871]